MNTRARLYEIVEKGRKSDALSIAYDVFMFAAILVSIVSLMFVEDYPIFKWFELVTVTIFILDYLFRWSTADLKLKKGGWSFLLYPVTPMAIIDLLSILPAMSILKPGFKILRITRLFKVMRMFKFLRYSDKIELLWGVIKKEKNVLLTVLGFAIFYVFVTALIMFNAEPHINPETGTATFRTFFDALYWATVTLTTVGYGDLCPASDIGRFVSMLSSLFGVAIIALPSGVITASYLEELRARRKEEMNGCDPDEEP